jgi:hypothetical protein
MSSDDSVSSLESCVRSRFDSKHHSQENLPSEGWELLTRAGVLLPAIRRSTANCSLVQVRERPFARGVINDNSPIETHPA